MSTMDKMKKQSKRVGIGVLGGIVLLVGIVAIPYPGPGWLIVFAGLGILATEFEWAKRLLQFGRNKYDAWNEWIKRQNRWVQSVTAMLTALVVVGTIYLLNGYGLVNGWLNLNLDWAESPLVR